MKEMNFNNDVSDDDDKLINLLKSSIRCEPSGQFAENTLEKFLILRTRQKTAHKPLKFPLYLMLVIGLILSAPVFITFSSQISFPDPRLELGNLFENISFQMDSWYILAPMLLILVLLSVVWFEFGLIKFRNPFI